MAENTTLENIMSLRVYGINHRTAPIDIREKLAFNEMQLPHALLRLTQHYPIHEAVILSTCNRTEFYTNADSPPDFPHWLSCEKLIDHRDVNQHGYLYEETDAVRHMMRVASGLDSMVLGEPQILGQMKQAYFAAQNTGTTGALFNQLFPAIFTTGKHIRTHTDIGANPVSIAYAITQLSKQRYDTVSDCQFLLIGAGETIQLIATHLHGIGVKKIVIANRTLEKSQAIAEAIGAEAIRIQDVPLCLKKSDVVISATTSQLPIIGKGMIENTLEHRKNSSLLLIDLAVPRDIEPEIAALERVTLYNIDDLQTIIAKNLGQRHEAAKDAETMIDLQATLFAEKMRVFRVRHIISEYRNRLEKIRLQEQDKAMHQLQHGHEPQKVLEQFGHNLINKIMHHPTVKLREAASEEHCDVFQQIKSFLELE